MSGTAYSQVPVWEREALIALYNALDGENWERNTGWLGDAGTECDWYGVTCVGGLITELYFWSKGLNGVLPPELGNFGSISIGK
jgi:hypothetical protein